MSNLSEIIHALARDGDTWHVNPSDDWRQGRTLFGGLSAALARHRVEDRRQVALELESAQRRRPDGR